MTDVVVTQRSVFVHDGRTYAEGETMKLPDQDVAAFEELGVVSRPGLLPPPGDEPASRP